MAKTLRTLVDPRFTTKNDELSFVELDTNFIETKDDIDDNVSAIIALQNQVAALQNPDEIVAHQEGNTAVTVIPSANTYVAANVTLTQIESAQGFSVLGSNSIINDSGVDAEVEIEISLSFDKSGGGGQQNFAIKAYDGLIPIAGRAVTSADTNDWGHATLITKAIMLDQETITPRIAGLADGDDVTVTDIQIKVKKVKLI